jgi:CDP-diacylglycerol--serine O-phosphatidyltransferase
MSAAARYIHPSNAVTYLSILAGLMAIVAARDAGSWSLAGALIAVSAAADTLDGRFARLFPRDEQQRRFGVELDSLADALTFGLVPVVALYVLLEFQSTAARVAWIAAALFYVVSAVTRLGYYDLHHGETAGFVGLPTTVAGLVWSSAFLLQPSVSLSTAVLVGCGIAMVSAVPIPRPRGLGLLAFGGWAAVLVVLHGVGARNHWMPPP